MYLAWYDFNGKYRILDVSDLISSLIIFVFKISS